MTRTISFKRTMATLAVAPLLLLAACGGDSTTLEGPDASESAKGGDGSTVVIAGQNYTEMQVMSAMYAALLENAGYKTQVKGVDTRDLYAPSLSKGKVDVVADYTSSMTEFLNKSVNGPDAKPVASPDVEETVAKLKELGADQNITALKPAEAEDANAFAVTTDFSQSNDVTSLSDLGGLGKPIALAAASDCPERADCQLGLTDVYGIKIGQFEPLGFGTIQTKDALKKGEVDVGQVGTSDGSLDQFGLVVLEDDKNWQNAENLVPVVNTRFLADNPDVEGVLNKLSDVLTTDDLKMMNAEVDAERKLPEDVAKTYLEDKGLI